MATEINKPVRRRTQRSYNVLFVSPRKARRIVVTILPRDVFEFRELGRKKRWYLAIDDAFRIAVRRQAAAEVAERRKKKGTKRKRSL